MRTLLLLAAAVAIHPCGVLAQSMASGLEVPVRKAVPVIRSAAASPAPVFTNQSSAIFRSGDTFELRLGGMPAEDALQFSQSFTVGSDGYLNIPLGGQIKAAGLTQSQLERAIEQKMIDGEIFRFPTATITVNGQRYVTVGGSVKNAGRFPWTSDLTLMSAISQAGGGDGFESDKIELIRGGKSIMYSTRKLNKNPSQDPQLLPGDRVEQR
jgi:protein involved in polysaccharide export with SLBB domain